MVEMILVAAGEIISKFTGLKALFEMFGYDFSSNKNDTPNDEDSHCTSSKQIDTKKQKNIRDKTFSDEVLLTILDRRKQFDVFEEVGISYCKKMWEKEKNDNLYNKPLVFILHGDEAAQLDIMMKRIHEYEIRKLSVTSEAAVKNREKKICNSSFKSPKLKHYYLGNVNEVFKRAHKDFDTELTRVFMRTVFQYPSEPILDNIIKQIEKENSFILIECSIAPEDLSYIKTRKEKIIKFIKYWTNLKGINQKKPIFVILSFKYLKNSLFSYSINSDIQSAIKETQTGMSLEGLCVLPEFKSMTKHEVKGWIKEYFHKCAEYRVEDEEINKIFGVPSYYGSFSIANTITAKQATAKFEQFLKKYPKS